MLRKPYSKLSLLVLITLLVAAFYVSHSSVTAQRDVPVVDVPDMPPSGPPHDIPLERQTCSQLHDTYNWASGNYSAANTAYRITDCDQILADPEASASDRAMCIHLDNNVIYWHNYATTVRAVGVFRGCGWAKP